ncbi:hypothetical protein [Bernardetia sp.]|uniref:hypothetical protein n=1 Tax=Bernardetia sp. TaxID=1937974 RepID=UPI0025BDE4C4|nr:hypothetical protein [Bernardetia sp.]
MKTEEQRLLEQEIRNLRKQNTILKKELSTLDKKSILFDEMIELAEKEYRIYKQKNANNK